MDRLVWCAALSGHGPELLGALARLHQACVDTKQHARGARAALWLGFHLLSLGEAARATGWFSRASRLVESDDPSSAEHGYLLLPSVYRRLGAGDNAAAQELASEAASIGERYQERDLVALARNLEGRARLRQGEVNIGLALLDEVMVAVTAGELSPLVTGIVYCNVIATCQQVYALSRAREWTLALTRWCDEQPQLVTFTGICLVHRSEISQLAGAWAEALVELQQVCDGRLKDADPEVLGEACYQRAEIQRLRGDRDDAEASYRLASQHGREPQPGLALLRLAQGQTQAAASTILRLFSTTTTAWQRAALLPAFVEITLAAGKLEEARAACEELEQIAGIFKTDVLQAVADHARGALRVAEGDTRGAIEPLRKALAAWRAMAAPYIAARIRVLLGRAFLALGDRDGAELELHAARQVFERLGAAPDLASLAAPDEPQVPALAHGLSPRELEVLRLVAKGMTNKAIARELGVSERTIHRHVSNILTKLGVTSRAAATAFAYETALF